MKTTFTLVLATLLSLSFQIKSAAQNTSSSLSASAASLESPNSGVAKFSSFNGNITNEKVLLHWTIEVNEFANQFEVEKSTNGHDFVMAGIVYGTDKKDSDDYMFYEKAKTLKTSYRIKIILKDGTAFYSPVITPALN